MVSTPAKADKEEIELIAGPEDGFRWQIRATGKGEIGVLSDVGDGERLLLHIYRPRHTDPTKFDYCPQATALVSFPGDGPEGREGV